MHIDHHPLASEFPDQRNALHTLKLGDAHFRRLMDDYEVVDKAVTRIENGEEHQDDLVLALMKRQRLALKDAIRACLDKAAA